MFVSIRGVGVGVAGLARVGKRCVRERRYLFSTGAIRFRQWALGSRALARHTHKRSVIRYPLSARQRRRAVIRQPTPTPTPPTPSLAEPPPRLTAVMTH